MRLPRVVERVVEVLSRRLALPARLEPEAAAHAAHGVAAVRPLARLGARAAVFGGAALEEHGARLRPGLEGERLRVARQQLLPEEEGRGGVRGGGGGGLRVRG